MSGLKRVYNWINSDARHENEPKRIVVLLRWIYLLKVLYFAVFFLLMFVGLPRLFSPLAVAALVVIVPLFIGTYYMRTRDNLIWFAVVQVGWILAFVYLYGWDCGVQHFIFALLVMFYFSINDALALKVVWTVFLFMLRFAMFCYCRVCDPVWTLPGAFVVVLQIFNSLFLFIELGVICGTFSSNVELAEEKLVQYNERLRQQASTDPLTGIWNRRTMLKHMEQFREQNSQAGFVVVMGDIDHFKHINDQWGHDCGDAVLKALTELFREVMKDRGSFSRWGGEEFLFHIPYANGDEAYAVISELSTRVQKLAVYWNDQEIHVTMTFGMEENDFRSDMKDLIKKVDEKLYYGKEAGRNRIVF